MFAKFIFCRTSELKLITLLMAILLDRVHKSRDFNLGQREKLMSGQPYLDN